ncbi:polyprenyl synthetase family protein [Leuconostoc carnosum]|uniref:Heptaprenyl diphosphate synthase, component II n=2 Tax=Leuconostoc carnosum TaxID=1252 RepID=K0D5H7_LEUCJ|nr:MULTISPECIES: polyprenyl synthetase family protein [Leuconostoc]AFT81099.1 heptaprenyl diphosphate synthase, component II [Leuconostoc carnosum JB16]KAA8326440.1 polyprenyl synthetase family protein [Leuconostoc carnosum]KAA8330697.1 polyprenyl synthetase family protein [Leuconostoc carnosum]KAA8362000.1 polyprenyl synthetase family protein [Leuconostoc carnosum]KAA8366548.1 polyprenyl synthetase family protein [Leuconostoc carnosum]
MSTPTLPNIWKTFPELKEPLQAVLVEMSSSWHLGFTEIDDAIRLQLNAGKLVRPALTLLFSELTNQPYNARAVSLGASVELLHLATLIHDDIIDDSKLRRGHESIQSQFGKDTAVYAGDYLLTGMFSLLNNADNTKANQLSLAALKEILFGELVQKQNRYDVNTNFTSYLSQIQGKTAALFRLSVSFGAISENTYTDDMLSIVSQLGENMGVTFQLLDDYLDFESITEHLSLGKPIGQDIRNGIYTAPVLFALEDEEINTEVKALLTKRDDITNEEMIILHDLINNSQAMSKLSLLLSDYSQSLDTLIKQLPNPKLQDQLQHVSQLLLNRDK